MKPAIVIGVIGASQATPDLEQRARELGAAIASHGWWLCCGGLGGVMAAACRGAADAGGHTIGILPGTAARDANPWVQLPIVTGIADARNTIIARTAHCCVAVGGSYGTLSEIAFCRKFGTPVAILSPPAPTSPLLDTVPTFPSVDTICRWIDQELDTTAK